MRNAHVIPQYKLDFFFVPVVIQTNPLTLSLALCLKNALGVVYFSLEDQKTEYTILDMITTHKPVYKVRLLLGTLHNT